MQRRQSKVISDFWLDAAADEEGGDSSLTVKGSVMKRAGTGLERMQVRR